MNVAINRTCNEAGQEHAIQTFDQQLYAIAQQVKWSKPDIFNRHILRLGGFHSLSCFLSSIGKLWADHFFIAVYTVAISFGLASMIGG
jgi:hypothetical protein